MSLELYNTLSRSVEPFAPMHGPRVTLYTCGPTVYSALHVGNWAAYIYWDILVRTLRANDFQPERVMNITDVGHLVSDEDDGEDKLQKGARREGKTAWEVAEYYTEDFMSGMEKLGLLLPEHVVRATDYITEQIDLIRSLKAKGYTYQIRDGIYFDTSKFPSYANFAHLDLAEQRAGARVEFNAEKRNPSDFALWKFSPAHEKRDMEWETPLDILDSDPGNDGPVLGFPGWHLECSAMAMSILGSTIDIHTGGIDHIPVHHTNEIAQSEAASGQLFAHTWLHNNHLKVNGTKISKSLENGFTLQQLAEKGFSALDYRMFVLQGHYQNEGNFTFENLEAAQNRLKHWRDVAALRWQTHDTLDQGNTNQPSLSSIGAVKEALNSNLNTPEALSVIDQVFSQVESTPLDAIDQQNLAACIDAYDELLGLQLAASTPDITDTQKQLIIGRERARDAKDWPEADRLRDELLEQGLILRDSSSGTIWQYA